jgi:flagellin
MANVDVTRIASNIGALNALNSLQNINAKLALHQTRLSTGKRINSAMDDPAGLTIATKMMARSEGLKASLDNISDAKNMLSVAEGGMSKMTDIMIQMRTKAEQAASDTLGNSERAAIQTQLSAYAQQIQDLVDQTKWNGVKLLDSSTGTRNFQTGVDEGETTTWNLPSALDPGTTGLNLSKRVSQATATASGTPVSFQNVTTLGRVETASANTNLTELSTGDYNFTVIDKATSATEGKATLDSSSSLLGGITNLTYSASSASATTMTSGKYTLKIDAATSDTTTSYTLSNLTDTTWGTNGKLIVVGANISAAGDLLDAAGGATLGVRLTLGAGGADTLSTTQTMTFEYIAKDEARVALEDSTGQAQSIANYKADGTTYAGSTTYSYAKAGTTYNSGRGATMKLHGTHASISSAVGSNEQVFTYERQNNYSVNVSNSAKAGAYMTTVNTALDKVNSALSDLGSLMARLSFKEEQSTTAQVNVEGAYNRIMNANMAEEQVNASKYTILQQTATAMLAQANAAPQSLLALFR